jgi:hypothetical protein
MTNRNNNAKPDNATLRDLLMLHRYARSRLPGQRLSANAFVRQEQGRLEGEGCPTRDVFKSSIARLEREFHVNVLLKRPILGNGEVDKDLLYPEDFPDFEAAVRPLPKGEQDDLPREPISWTNKEALTLDGEIFGEVASILAGYLSLARQATRPVRDPVPDERAEATYYQRRVGPGVMDRQGRSLAADRKLVLAYLRDERRRLHDTVSMTLGEGGSVFELHRLLPEDSPEISPSDTIQMDAPRSARERRNTEVS